MATLDYYAILGIRPGASAEEIKRAYRELVLKFHPDRNPGDQGAEAKIREINAAYEVLSDIEARQTYERLRFGAEPRETPPDPIAILEAMVAKLFDEGRKEIFSAMLKDLPRVRAELAVVRQWTVAAPGYDAFKEPIVAKRGAAVITELVSPEMEARKKRIVDVALRMMISAGVVRRGDEEHCNEVRARLQNAIHSGRVKGYVVALELLYERR
jgi:molecular chaperone DnaJ